MLQYSVTNYIPVSKTEFNKVFSSSRLISDSFSCVLADLVSLSQYDVSSSRLDLRNVEISIFLPHLDNTAKKECVK